MFSGIGGIDLAADWAEFETILQVEKDPYCRKVLAKHWPNVKRIERVEDVTAKSVARPVTLVSGGPPCQPSSTAGKRRGRADDRWLWPEFARIVECFLPTWILAENPPGILSLENSLAIEEWLARLEVKNYAFLPPIVYPIAALGADHRRYRVFFVAHLDGIVQERKQVSISRSGISAKPTRNGEVDAYVDGKHGDVGGHGAGTIFRQRSETANLQNGKTSPNAEGGRREKIGISERSRTKRQGTIDAAWIRKIDADANCTERTDIQRKPISAKAYGRRSPYSAGWWDTRSRLLRMVHGIRGRMDGCRIRALGNSCSPQQVYPILKAIADIEMEGER